MHRFGLDGMLQVYGGNLKKLQNRSPSSLHGKQPRLTKSQWVVLYFYNASLGQHKKWIIWAGRHCHLIDHDCVKFGFRSPVYRRSPVRIVRLTHRLCALASQQQANSKLISRFGLEPWKLSDLLAGDAALQVGMKIASNQRPFRFQTQLFNCANPLLGSQHHVTEKPQASTTFGADLLGLNTRCIFFEGLHLCQFWMVQAGWASLQVETRNLFCTWNKLKSQERKSSLAIRHVESEAAWSKDPHKAEQTLQWKHQKNNDENDFESNLNTLQEKDEAGPKLARHHLETCKGSDCIARLRYWIFA